MINYPNQMKKSATVKTKKTVDIKKANLGIAFENKINESNKYFLEKGIAAIYKKPTPVRITKVEYPSRNKAKITEAYYQMPSTTDYNGLYKGYYIDFEAKCCHSTSFSFTNIYTHQINHLKTIDNMGGIAFLLIEFPNHNEIFLLPAKNLCEKYQSSLKGGRKSISYQEFKNEGILVKEAFNPRIDYLKAVDIYIMNKQKGL